MEVLNKQIDSRQQCENLITGSSLDNESQPDRDDEGAESSSRRDILWTFTNADKLKEEYWSRLESRMLDIYQGHPGIRFLITSSAENRKFHFTCFKRDEELQEINNAQKPADE